METGSVQVYAGLVSWGFSFFDKNNSTELHLANVKIRTKYYENTT